MMNIESSSRSISLFLECQYYSSWLFMLVVKSSVSDQIPPLHGSGDRNPVNPIKFLRSNGLACSHPARKHGTLNSNLVGGLLNRFAR